MSENNLSDEIKLQLRTLMLRDRVTQVSVAEKIGIRPQALTKLWEKKNFSLTDLENIAGAIGYKVNISFDPIRDE